MSQNPTSILPQHSPVLSSDDAERWTTTAAMHPLLLLLESDPAPYVFAALDEDSLGALEAACRGVSAHLGREARRVDKALRLRSRFPRSTTIWAGQLLRLRLAASQRLAATGKADVACGGSHSLVVSGGDVWSFGSGEDGRLGHGEEAWDEDERSPRLIETLRRPAGLRDRVRVCQVAAGDWHSMARTADGDVYAWGCGEAGQLGLGDTEHRRTPTRVEGLRSVSMVAAGGYHSMAVTHDMKLVLTCGSGECVGLPQAAGTGTPVLTFTLVPFLCGVAAVAAGTSHSLALDDDGMVWAWGSNDFGQLGVGDMVARAEPVAVSRGEGLRRVVDIAAGRTHSVAVTLDGDVFSWGPGGEIPATGQITPDCFEGAPCLEPLRLQLFGDPGQFGYPARREAPTTSATGTASSTSSTTSSTTGSTIGSPTSSGSGSSSSNDGEQKGETDSAGAAAGAAVAAAAAAAAAAPPPSAAAAPVATATAHIVRVAAGEWHSLCVARDGRLFTWGMGECGQLGHGPAVGMLLSNPVAVALPGVLVSDYATQYMDEPDDAVGGGGSSSIRNGSSNIGGIGGIGRSCGVEDNDWSVAIIHGIDAGCQHSLATYSRSSSSSSSSSSSRSSTTCSSTAGASSPHHRGGILSSSSSAFPVQPGASAASSTSTLLAPPALRLVVFGQSADGALGLGAELEKTTMPTPLPRLGERR